MPSCVASEKWSRIARHDDSALALPRWHSSTITRSKKSEANRRNMPFGSPPLSASAW